MCPAEEAIMVSEHPLLGALVAFVVSILAGFYVSARWTTAKQRALPPGPKGWPVLGNINDMPPAGVPESEFWLEHKDKYGQLVFLFFFILMGYYIYVYIYT